MVPLFGFVVVTAMMTAALVLVNVAANMGDVRFDLTRTGAHRLSDRTTALIESLAGETEIVVAVRRASMDARVADRVDDTLDAIDRQSDLVRVTRLDLDAPRGRDDFEALIARLADGERELVNTHATIIEQAGASLRESADWATRLGASLEGLRDAMGIDSAPARTNAQALDQRAGVARLLSRELVQIADRADTLLGQTIEPLGLPDVGTARTQVLTGGRGYEHQLSSLQVELTSLSAAEGTPPNASDLALAIVGAIGEERERVAVALDPLTRLITPNAVRVASALAGDQAVIVIGPSAAGVTAIDPRELFGTLGRLDAAGLGEGGLVARNAEDLFNAAFTALSSERPPIVCLTHAELASGLAAQEGFRGLVDRLRRRGIDLVEWATAVDETPPAFTTLDPTGERPVVYLVLATDASGSGGRVPQQSGSNRAARLAEVTNGLIAANEPVLLCLLPSILPSFGDTDPMVSAIAEFGLEARTGHPLLRSTPAAIPSGDPVIRSDFTMTASGDTAVTGDRPHPLADAIAGLPTQLWWVTPLRIDPLRLTEDVVITPLLSVAASPDTWSESEWIGFWQTPAGQRSLGARAPSPGGPGDSQAGPWNAAVAIERAAGGDAQRLIVVGSVGWLRDEVAGQIQQIDGRLVQTVPGNAELLESGVMWLAERDDLIGRGASSAAIARIRPLPESGLSTVRWVLLGALPLVVLLLGIGVRLIRG